MTTKINHKFTLDGAIVPKARPRVTRRGTFLPKRYREWKKEAIAALASQKTQFEPLGKTTIEIELYGNCRGDLDNIAGAILDALVQAEIIQDDRISLVSELSIKHHSGKTKQAIVNVKEV